MVPPAPPTFSTITGWPSDVFIRSETTRATMSVMPPAANGTMTVTGLVGKPCACAFTVPPSATAHAIKNGTHFHCIDVLPLLIAENMACAPAERKQPERMAERKN